jgi:glycosyltransferase involved in cell wall biosynthesis
LLVEGWRTDASARLAGFDAFVLPSFYEGLPLALLEAMAAGLPCIVSDADGMSEAVIDEQQGRVLPPGNVAAWVMAIGQLLGDRSLSARWGAAALERHRQYFSREAMGRSTAEIYREVIARFQRQ